MLETLRDQLLALQEYDIRVRTELAADGSLYAGYHPRMEAVHRENAAALRAIIDRHGWPSEALVGSEGAAAAWLIAQHAIGEPAFMRHCRELLDEASAQGKVPRWQFAYLDDRVRILEGRPQRYGTQFDIGPDGPRVCEIEDESGVAERRRVLGLKPIAELLAAAGNEPRPTVEAAAEKDRAARAWRRAVGWIA